MDIFTTALTRVVPVPIKPANLKVKALKKAAPTNDVSDDIEGFEESASYFHKPMVKKALDQDKDENKAQDTLNVVDDNKGAQDKGGQHIDVLEDSESSPLEEQEGKPHLDLFV